MKKTLLAVSALVLTIACSSGAPPAEAPAAAPADGSNTVPDSEIGLAPGTAFEQPEQNAIGFNAVDPGDSELRERPNADFPPVIPHTIADLETITLTENSCLDCHDPEMAPDMGAVAVPATHRVDLRRSPDVAGDETEGSRWVCTSCHIAQTDTVPLVTNSSSE